MRYRSPTTILREDVLPPPTEMELQALWFEQWLTPVLTTDDGQRLKIIQPGFWNHGAGPDFSRTAYQWEDDSEIQLGSSEIHLRAQDWNLHHHDADPAYDDTILHVVWGAASPRFYPATSKFKRIPQVILSRHLIAPWPVLRPLTQSLIRAPLPDAKPGRCQANLSELSQNDLLQLIRQAGLYRLQQKALRWKFRQKISSPEQALWEALAEALGFHTNQIPFRLIAQRLPWATLRNMDHNTRTAHIFGLAGFLPSESTRNIPTESRVWLHDLWEIWWKVRTSLEYSILPKSQWKLAGQRPLNRPERRLAALSHLVPLIPQLLHQITSHDSEVFSGLLLKIRDPFWENRSTLVSTKFTEPVRLIGQERLNAILINIFWPLVAPDEPELASTALSSLKAPDNKNSRTAGQRVLDSLLPKKYRNEALVQQGLLQIFRDYCLTDCTRCARCTFPERISPGTLE